MPPGRPGRFWDVVSRGPAGRCALCLPRRHLSDKELVSHKPSAFLESQGKPEAQLRPNPAVQTTASPVGASRDSGAGWRPLAPKVFGQTNDTLGTPDFPCSNPNTFRLCTERYRTSCASSAPRATELHEAGLERKFLALRSHLPLTSGWGPLDTGLLFLMWLSLPCLCKWCS